jgi:cytochrome c biogenesis protein CcdA
MLIVGFLVALVEFPCTGGPYVLTLGLLHDNVAFAKVFAYLFFYNIVFVLPLVIILLIASHKQLLDKVKGWKKKSGGEFDFWSAIAMIALGIVIFLL